MSADAPTPTATDPNHIYDDLGDRYCQEWDEEEGGDDDDMNCHLGRDGQCGAAGSEYCDFECWWRGTASTGHQMPNSPTETACAPAEPFLREHKRRPTAKRDGIVVWLTDEIAYLESIGRTEYGNGRLDAFKGVLEEVSRG
jgi:hypothetical protein